MVKRVDIELKALTAPELAEAIGVSYRRFVEKDAHGVAWWERNRVLRDLSYKPHEKDHYRWPPHTPEAYRKSCR